MAQLLEWHRREEKAAWWEYFRLLDLPLEDYADERSALAGLAFVGDRRRHGRANPSIATCSRRRSTTCAAATRSACPSTGEVARQDRRPSTSPPTRSTSSTRAASRTCGPSASSSGAWCRRGRSLRVLLEIGRWIAANGVDAPGEHRAARDLLLRRPPRLVRGSRGLAAESARAGGRRASSRSTLRAAPATGSAPRPWRRARSTSTPRCATPFASRSSSTMACCRFKGRPAPARPSRART